jgi:hypothetical protein
MKILRITDKILIKEKEIEVTISPLTHGQKMEISDCMKLKAGQTSVDYQKTAMLSLKFSIKDIKGLTNYDNTEYKLDFDDSGLSDECVGELMTALSTTQIFTAINSALANNLEADLDGVEVSVLPKK